MFESKLNIVTKKTHLERINKGNDPLKCETVASSARESSENSTTTQPAIFATTANIKAKYLISISPLFQRMKTQYTKNAMSDSALATTNSLASVHSTKTKPMAKLTSFVEESFWPFPYCKGAIAPFCALVMFCFVIFIYPLQE